MIEFTFTPQLKSFILPGMVDGKPYRPECHEINTNIYINGLDHKSHINISIGINHAKQIVKDIQDAIKLSEDTWAENLVV